MPKRAKETTAEPHVETAPEAAPAPDPPAQPAPEPIAPPPAADIVDEVMRLQTDLAAKKDLAIKTLLEQRADIERKLKALGWTAEEEQEPITNFQRTTQPEPPTSTPPPSRRDGVRAQKPPADRFCKYCSIQGHDARAHRGQAKPKAFTKSELRQFGYA